MRTTPNVNEELRRSDDAMNNKHIPSFSDNKLCGNDERLLLSLPTKLGGMGTSVFPEITEMESQNLPLLTEENISLLALQERTYRIQKETINKIKKELKRERQERNQ